MWLAWGQLVQQVKKEKLVLLDQRVPLGMWALLVLRGWEVPQGPQVQEISVRQVPLALRGQPVQLDRQERPDLLVIQVQRELLVQQVQRER